MKPAVGAARLLLHALAVVLALEVNHYACAQTPQKKQQTAPRPVQQPKRADDRRWQELMDQAEAQIAKGEYARGEDTGRQLAEEALRLFGDSDPDTATSLNVLADAQMRQGKYADAQKNFSAALNIYEKRLGPEHVNTAAALNNLALVLEKLGDYPSAESLLRRSLRILEKTLGKEHQDTATTLSNLGRVLDLQGKFSETTGRGADEDTKQLSARAQELINRGQYKEAETLHYRVVAIHEKTLGKEHPGTATSLSNLGNVLYLQGKAKEAEAIHRRVLALREKMLGSEHPDTATSMNNLANVLQEQGKDELLSPSEARAQAQFNLQAFTETESLFRKALAIQERTLGPGHPATANTLNNLSTYLDRRGRAQEAEPLQRRALDILERSLGSLHPDTAAMLTTLAVMLDRQGKVVEAEALYRKAVEVARRAGNPRILLLNSSRLGFSLAKHGRYREALPFYKEAADTLDYLYVRTRGLSEETRAAFLGQYGNIYLETIKVLLQLHRTSPQGGYDREVLEIASRNQSRVFTEMMRQADVAKFSDDPAFLGLKRKREDLHEKIENLRLAVVTQPLDQPGLDARRSDLDAQLAAAKGELAPLEEALWRDYPRFMELTNPRPVSVQDLQQKLLRPDEVLLSYVLLPQEVAMFAVTRERFRMVNLPVKREDVARRVRAIRRAIEKVAVGESVLFLREIDPADLNSLYRDLVAPLSSALAGKQKIIVVADGPLLTVPLELLVTHYGPAEQQAFESARAASDGNTERPFLGEYGELAYLGKEHRFAYLPSLSALASQRLYPKRYTGPRQEFTAFADPIFAPPPGQSYSPATRAALGLLANNYRVGKDGLPDIPRLRETADEARSIARILGGSSRMFIGAEAQEHMAKLGELKNSRYVLFATHGFLGGEFLPGADPAADHAAGAARAKSGAQPSLALTLAGDLNGEDGMLTMKEVIEDVELNADLVALSACNTAGETAQANNGEGFAGLTRAFMYAGAKSLLVSHWSVDSLSTEALMTSTFRNIKQGETALKAVSDAQRELRRGSYASGQYRFSRSHPFFWAAFVYVGD
ncbi:MAG: tetratricopeptide repeat protein [Betaproteobacteria bacterium]|nr:MAG: tetratricopeptide repeat protein [Betaproteobacteria bacterium]